MFVSSICGDYKLSFIVLSKFIPIDDVLSPNKRCSR